MTGSQPDELDEEFEALLRYLKESRGFDFTGYKRASLMRRVDRRMGVVGVHSYPDYIDRLQVNPDEFAALFNTILINVTRFFRDQEAWDFLQAKVVPTLLAGREPDEQIRVWSAGCASGEEAYSLAMMFAEALGIEQFRQRVKIYATDVDEDALTTARQAAYTERDVQGVPPDLLTRYFEPLGDRQLFRKDLRRSVIFGRNDLVQDAPISRIDLLACRNTLMYYNAETQARILRRFHFALTPNGMLFLGKAEMLLTHGRLFEPIELKRRIFRKAEASTASAAGALTSRVWTRCESTPSRRARWRRWWSRPTTRWPWSTGRRRRCSGCRVGTSAARSATWRSPTARWSCAPTSSRPGWSGASSGSRTCSGSTPAARPCGSRCTSTRW
jgi:two-component system CheB/CheR fusion protein